jgi:hypothetical protein
MKIIFASSQKSLPIIFVKILKKQFRFNPNEDPGGNAFLVKYSGAAFGLGLMVL